MTFTKELPTRPGAYWWRANPGDKFPTVCELYPIEGELMAFFVGEPAATPVRQVNGEWCELVPRDETVPKGEIEKAYCEGWAEGYAWNQDGHPDCVNGDFEKSRAKRVMEGKE